MGGDGAILTVELERAERAGEHAHAAVLVEGVSDRRALEALAQRRGRYLPSEGVQIIATAGITNAGRFLPMALTTARAANIGMISVEAKLEVVER